MTYGVYSVIDRKSTWLTPTVDISDDVAIRNFAYAVQHNDMISDFATDYELYKIGEFDAMKGEITPIPREFLAGAIDFKRSVQSTEGV